MIAHRADVERNHGCVLDAFAEQGPGVSLDEAGAAVVVNGLRPAPSGG